MPDSLEAVYDEYALDPGLHRPRGLSPVVWPDGHAPGIAEVCVLADSPLWVGREEWLQAAELLRDYKPRITYVFKFEKGNPPRREEWQAAKALVAREVRLTRPRFWVPVGPASCDLLGVPVWQNIVASMQVDYLKSSSVAIQGGWSAVRKTADVLFGEEFATRG